MWQGNQPISPMPRSTSAEGQRERTHKGWTRPKSIHLGQRSQMPKQWSALTVEAADIGWKSIRSQRMSVWSVSSWVAPTRRTANKALPPDPWHKQPISLHPPPPGTITGTLHMPYKELITIKWKVYFFNLKETQNQSNRKRKGSVNWLIWVVSSLLHHHPIIPFCPFLSKLA